MDYQRPVYLYIVRVGKRLKIGATRSLVRRLKEIGLPLILVHVSTASFRVERRVHMELDEHRIRGEWYRWSRRLQKLLPKLVALQTRRYAPHMSDEGESVPNNPETATKGPSKLAAAMEKARKDRGVTQGQLAERLHVKQAMVSMIESGEAEYSEELAGRIRGWIDSGAGPLTPPKRGPYKTRTTIQR